MPIKAFVFDCGGVLFRDGDLTPYDVWAERAGITPEALRQLLWASDFWRQAECGQITDARYWELILQELGLDDETSPQDLKQDLWTTWELDSALIETIDELRKHYSVSMLSNATDDLECILDTFGVSDRFEHIINSARVGTAKPDKAIFAHTLERIGFEPDQVVFIDDRAENITAASGVGMHVIWYVGLNELRRRLSLFDHNLSF